MPPTSPSPFLLQLELSLDDLKRNFRKHTIAATIQCAGNRRNELNKGAGRGPPWARPQPPPSRGGIMRWRLGWGPWPVDPLLVWALLLHAVLR